VTLFCGPWPGEFGVFLGWQACARWKATQLRNEGKISRVVMCARPGWEYLVSDFVDEYIPVEFPGIPIGSFAHGGLDRADIARMVPKDAIHCPGFHSRHWGNDFVEHAHDKVPAPQSFVRYGTERLAFRQERQILLHARWRQDWGVRRNWSAENWRLLAQELAPHGKLVSIGSPSGSLLVEGTEDARGEDLAVLASRMCSALCVVGPSSGPMHYAALCGAPHVVWFGGDDGSPQAERDKIKIATLLDRYQTAWNPFGTPVCPIIANDWQPRVADVLDRTKQALEGNFQMVEQISVHQNADMKGYTPPWSLGAFQHGYVAPVVRGRLGVGILVRNALTDLREGLASVVTHGGAERELLVFDNGTDAETPAWMAKNHSMVPYIRSFRNTGCWNARNRMLEHFAARGCEFVLFQDQDVRWTGDVAEAMLAVFQQHPDTGCVSWTLATETMGKHAIDATGALSPPESPGMCCMFSVAALLAGADPGLVAWHHGYGLCFLGDTDVCFSLASKGFKTRVVLGPCLVEHVHPHRGTGALGRQREVEIAYSVRVFRERRKQYKWPSL